MFTVKSVHVHQIDFLRHMQKDGNDIKNLFHEGLEGNKLPCQFFTKRNYCPNQLHDQYFIKSLFFSVILALAMIIIMHRGPLPLD